MPTLGSTEIMREILKSGARSAKSSITRRLARLEINDAGKPAIMHQEFQRLRGKIQSDLGGDELLNMTELQLVDAFASHSVVHDFVNDKFIQEANVENFKNLAELGMSLTRTMLSVAQKLGTKRQTKMVPTMREFLKSRGHLEDDPAGDDGDDGEDSDEDS
jgi:hypothetical protein